MEMSKFFYTSSQVESRKLLTPSNHLPSPNIIQPSSLASSFLLKEPKKVFDPLHDL